ncbi:MAG: septal ring lytic transglycosylase RlpA family protein [Candidatus Kapaibacterium sp.]|nr:MAG: septal ring lytic transglycosylase RlpA family protein [Candidatus Kapabacteria bacterium]
MVKRVLSSSRYIVALVLLATGTLYSIGVQAEWRVLPFWAASLTKEPSTIAANSLLQRGVGSWYGPGFHGRMTASGEIYDMNDYTAAHQTLPLGTVVRVTNEVNGKSALVRINDRGPYIDGRIIDLSFNAAKTLDIVQLGTSDVTIEIIEGIRLSDTTKLSNFLSDAYEFVAMKDLLSATAFSHSNLEPLVVEQGTFRVIHENDNLTETLKTWKKLRKKHGQVFLIPLRKTELQLQEERTQKKRRNRTPPSLYRYQLLRLDEAPHQKEELA